MPSPNHRAKSASLPSKSVTRPTSRRHLANTSAPVPFDFSHTALTSIDQPQNPQQRQSGHSRETMNQPNMPQLTHARSGSNLQYAEMSQDRLSVGPSVIMSSMSSMPELKQVPKKPSGIKATIKRMFGSKRQRTIVDEANREYHRSDPGNLMIATTSQSRQASSQGSSRPRTSMQKTALGSHAVNPATAIRDFEFSSPPRPSAPQRRNTLPSLAFSEHEAQSFSRRLGDLMTSDLERAALPDTITPIKDKRRSKSTEALTAQYITDSSDASTRQDRDTEIAFWRNSMLLNPLPRSTILSVKDQPGTELSEEIKEVPSLEQIIKPAQSFDFGLGGSNDEPMDLEERVSTLEVKMFDFEYAIAKLQGVDLPKPALPTKKWRRKNVQEVYSKPSMQSLSTATSGFDRPPVTPGDSPIMTTSSKEDLARDRTSKATTIRPIVRTGSPLRTSLRLTTEQFEHLMSLIQDEKDARQLMELQMIDMQREIELLQAPVYATINYPTTNTESKASTQKKLHRSPPFHFHRQTPRETSRFSMAESDNESADNGPEETFLTPREQQYAFDTKKHSPIIGLVS